MNTGLDEILEVAKVWTTTTTQYLNRALLQFDITTFPSSIFSGSTAGSRKFYLKLYATEPENLKSDYEINALAISGSWTMGQGKRFNTPITTTGVSWDFRNTLITTASNWQEWWYNSGSTQSTPTGSHDDFYGGAWNNSLTSSLCSQSFSYTTADTNIDVTQIVEKWIAGTYPNHGVVVKFPDSYETGSNIVSYGTLKFFSKDTNTVYKPKLILKYDDSVTSSAAPVAGTLNADDIAVYVKGLKSQYPVSSIDKIRVLARDRYPAKTFSVTQSQYVSFNYLPTASYYGVKDAYTGEMVVDYDTLYSKLSSDSSGNYFNFNFGTLFTGRLYKFVLRVDRGSLTQYFDSDLYFKVIK